MVSLEGLSNSLNSFSQFTNKASSTIDSGTRVLDSGTRLYGNIADTFSPSESKSKKGSRKSAAPEADSPVTNFTIAPDGTRIIIRPEVSLTNNARYLGDDVYDAVVCLLNKRPGSEGIVIVDENTGLPSTKVYDQVGENRFVIKGTSIPVDLNIVSLGNDPKYKSLMLTETELASIAAGFVKQDVNAKKFETTGDLGKAETIVPPDFLTDNWKWLVPLIMAMLVTGLSVFLAHRSKKKTKKTTNATQELKTENETLTQKLTQATQNLDNLKKQLQESGKLPADTDTGKTKAQDKSNGS